LAAAFLDKQIMEKKREGHGIEKIARFLGCSTWRVTKRLGNL
jgi:hypothetical protein